MNRYRSPFVTCRGPSMAPALRNGDGLTLAECAGPAGIRRGDIIVYPHPSEPFDVAHRVVRVLPAGVKTRGDANARIDPGVVHWPEIRGRVSAVRRGANTFVPASGRRGTAAHYLGRMRSTVRRLAARSFRFADESVGRTGLLRFLGGLIPTSVLAVGREGDQIFILRHRGKNIGRKSALIGGRWDIRLPYRLILDRAKLP